MFPFDCTSLEDRVTDLSDIQTCKIWTSEVLLKQIKPRVFNLTRHNYVTFRTKFMLKL